MPALLEAGDFKALFSYYVEQLRPWGLLLVQAEQLSGLTYARISSDSPIIKVGEQTMVDAAALDRWHNSAVADEGARRALRQLFDVMPGLELPSAIDGVMKEHQAFLATALRAHPAS